MGPSFLWTPKIRCILVQREMRADLSLDLLNFAQHKQRSTCVEIYVTLPMGQLSGKTP
jgi:hypothetical protein